MSLPLQIRPATRADLPECYLAAFEQMENSPYFELVVAEMEGRLVGPCS